MTGRFWLLLVVVAALVAAGAFAVFGLEGTAPEVRTPEQVLVGATPRAIEIELSDEGTGLRGVTVILSHAEGDQTLVERELPGNLLTGGERGEPLTVGFAIDPARLPRQVDQAFLRVRVRDWSWRGGFSGNETSLDVPVAIDRAPPRIDVATGLTYVRRGGTGVVVYSVSEPAIRDGVSVGDVFFPGHPVGERRVAFYAVPADAPESPQLRVVAEDEAGNVAEARWPVVVKEREMPRADVNLPASFLEDVVPGLARSEGIDASDRNEAFRRINTEVRAANEARIREALAATSPTRLFEGPFEQLRNSKVTSRFAERRRYLVGGEPVSEATHYGYDLASTRAAPVTAAAAGRVAFADALGIYGNCVVIDHGWGVATLYGHLSRLDVEAGQRVERGARLGLSGATGLAGGDHLHFAVLVGGTYVDPLEWWDPKWFASNVEDRLASAGR